MKYFKLFNRMNLSFDWADLILNSNTKSYAEVKRFKDIESLLTQRVINKIASSVIYGWDVDFMDEKINENYIEFEKRFNLWDRLYEAVQNSMLHPNGSLIYFAGGKLSDPIRKLEAVNSFSAEFVKILDPDPKRIFLPDYHDKAVMAKVEGGETRIHNSRNFIINLYPGKTQSYAQRVLPKARVVESIVESCGYSIDKESGMIYKTPQMKGDTTEETKKGFEHAVSKIVQKLKIGRGAVVPEEDEIVMLGSNTNIEKYFPAIKEAFAAEVGVPKSMIFGEEKSGLNTGAGKEKDKENFMNDVTGWQETQIEPVISSFVRVFLAGRIVPYSITFDLPKEISAAEQVDMDVKYNSSIAQLVSSGVIDEEIAAENLKGIKK